MPAPASDSDRRRTPRREWLAEPPAALRYGVAAAATGAALGVSLVFPVFVHPNVFIFFFAAVVVAAWFGGRGPALLATLVSLLLVNRFVLPPPFTWTVAPQWLSRLAVFAAVAVLIGSMRTALDRVRRQAEATAGEAERHARIMEDQATELEHQAAELELAAEDSRALADELAEANRRLEESTARQLAEAQALAHVGSWEWLIREDRVTWSDEMYRLHGMEPGSPVDRSVFLARVHPDDRERVRAAMDEAARTLLPFELDHRIVRPGGELRLLHARGRVEADAQGRAVRMTGSGQDVTAARAAEDAERRIAAASAARAAAEEGRARLESILEGIGEAFVAIDAEWRYTFVNSRAEAMMGKPRAELLGRPVWEVFPQAVGSLGWERLHRVAERGEPVRYEHLSPALDRWLAVRASPWDGGISVFYEDVTERRKAREESARLAAIVESSEDAIFAKSLSGEVLTWNAAAERLYGYTAAEMVGRPVSTLAPPERKDEIPAILARLAAGGRIESFETVRRRKDGSLVDVMLAVSPVLDGDGRVVAASTIARDITGRRRTEAALRASEARYRRIIETAEEGVWVLDTAGRTEYANERMGAMLGVPAATLAGRPFAEFVHPHGRAAAARLAAGRLDTPERHDLRLVRADGSDLWALVSLTAVTGDDGGWTGALAMVTDVTDRRRAEESVRFLAEASRVLAQSLDTATVLREIAGLAVPRLADWCAVVTGGAAPAVEVAHADPALAPLVRQLIDLRRGAPELDQPIRQAVAAGRAVRIGENARAALGVSGDARAERLLDAVGMESVMVVPMPLEKGIEGAIVLVVADPARRFGETELHTAQELGRRAATALENARLHAAEHDARRAAERSAGIIARLQAVTAAMSEARTPHEVAAAALDQSMQTLGAAAGWIGRVSGDGARVELLLAHGFDAAVVDEFRDTPLERSISLADAVRTGEIICLESREELERRYPGVPDRGQRSRYGAWAVVPMWIEGRAVGGLVLNFLEARGFDAPVRSYLSALGRQSALALERARLYEAERSARAEAESANQAKFDFLTTMSHELRTPLNAIAGYVDLLDMELRGPLTPEQRSDLDRIRRSQTHLLGLINDVLNFARIETGHVHLDLRDVELDPVLAEVEELIAPQVGARGVSYEYRRPPAPVRAHADPEKVRQVVLNLLSNAVKFTPAGGTIVLRAEAGAGAALIRVEDTGIGIPADKLGTIFDPFVQVNAGYTRTTEGTGLGLSISRDLARAMGGELTVESREGAGSVFTVVLRSAES